MKNIFSILSIGNLKKQVSEVAHRFPIPTVILAITAILFFSLVHENFFGLEEDTIIRSALSLIITFFLSVGSYISCEAGNKRTLCLWGTQLFSIVFGIGFFFGFDSTLDNFENFVFFILSLVGILGFLFFAPYVKNIFQQKEDITVYYTYFYNVSAVFLTSIILAIILFLLGNIGIFAVFELFDITNISQGKVVGDWAVIALSIITPIFGLSQLPKKNSFEKNHFNENVFFSFLIKYIAIPFIYIYFFILYAYSIKVLLTFGDWPKGEVSWMVIGFSIFGYITYVFSYIFEQKNKFILAFRKAFPWVVIPQIFMLFYAIYLRIEQYDLTINRYFVVIFGIWLLIISLYYALSKVKKLSLVVSLLTLFTILISVGPWSVYHLPENRQLDRLKENLTQAEILQDEKIIPLSKYSDIDPQLGTQIYSGIEYLCNYSNCKQIKTLFVEQYDALVEETKKNFEESKQRDREEFKNNPDMLKEIEQREYTPPRNWEIISHISNEIKVQSYYDTNDQRSSILSFNLKEGQYLFPIDTTGYTKIHNLVDYKGENNRSYAKISIEERMLIIYEASGTSKSIDISSYIDSLALEYKINKERSLDASKLTYVIDNYKIILENITIANPEYNGENAYTWYYANGFVLEK